MGKGVEPRWLRQKTRISTSPPTCDTPHMGQGTFNHQGTGGHPLPAQQCPGTVPGEPGREEKPRLEVNVVAQGTLGKGRGGTPGLRILWGKHRAFPTHSAPGSLRAPLHPQGPPSTFQKPPPSGAPSALWCPLRGPLSAWVRSLGMAGKSPLRRVLQGLAGKLLAWPQSHPNSTSDQAPQLSLSLPKPCSPQPRYFSAFKLLIYF